MAVGFTRRATLYFSKRAALNDFSLQFNVNYSANTVAHVKAFKEIPGPKGLPLIGTLKEAARAGAFSGDMHKYFEDRYKQYGPIFRENWGMFNWVFLHDPDDIAELFRQEDKYPFRVNIEAWPLARKEIKEAKGLLLSSGEDWQRYRSVLNKQVMRPQVVNSYHDGFLQVATEMTNKLKKRRSSDMVVEDIRDKLFSWSIESAGTMLFETRLGCLADRRPVYIDRFIQNIMDMLQGTETLLLVPPKVAKVLRLPVWRKHVKAWRELYSTGKLRVDTRIWEIERRQRKGERVEGLLVSLLESNQLTRQDVYANLIDLMIASVDTTASTAQWMIHLLSVNPDKQDRLYREIMSVARNEKLTPGHLDKMPYLKAVVKETLRMYPVAPSLTRTLEKEVIIHGYRIPPGVVFNIMLSTLRNDPRLFNEPKKFRPERWLREEKDKENINAFAQLSFGFGPRACIGRRVAELELYLLLAQLIRTFKFEPTAKEDIPLEMRILLQPKVPIRVKFLDR